MTSSNVARTATRRNKTSKDAEAKAKFQAEVGRIIKRYEDSGTSGASQKRKELKALEEKYADVLDKSYMKNIEDRDNVWRYGKDSMKGRGFAQYNKGGMAKKQGYAKGGYVSCGASNKPGQKRTK